MSAVTEEQAAGMWCPAARVLLPVNKSGNRIGTFHKTIADDRDRQHYAQQEADCNCLGSRCMWWRWAAPPFQRIRVPKTDADARSETEPPRPADLPDSWTWDATYAEDGEARWKEPIAEANKRREGFCGMAGRPTP